MGDVHTHTHKSHHVLYNQWHVQEDTQWQYPVRQKALKKETQLEKPLQTEADGKGSGCRCVCVCIRLACVVILLHTPVTVSLVSLRLTEFTERFHSHVCDHVELRPAFKCLSDVFIRANFNNPRYQPTSMTFRLLNKRERLLSPSPLKPI